MTTAEGHTGLVYYGLGNFMSNQTQPETALGGVAQFTVEKDAAGCHIADHALVPTVCHFEAGTTAVYRLSSYTEELAKRHTIRKNTPDFSVRWLRKLVPAGD